MMLYIVLIIFSLGLLIYYKVVKPHQYWSSVGVKQKSFKEILKLTWLQLKSRKSLAEVSIHFYQTAPGERYFGLYFLNTPVLLLKDPDLIKTITVKDFEHFPNRSNALPEDIDYIWSKNLVALTGKKWHDMRSTLSPSFTSSKMRQMFSLILSTTEQFCQHFAHNDSETITLEMYDVFTKLTNDVIASTAFGIHVDTLQNPNNEFYRYGREISDSRSYWRIIKVLFIIIFPRILKLIKIDIFRAEIGEFFKNIIKDTIETRKKKNIYRPDMIQLMMDAKRNLEMQEFNIDGGNVHESFAVKDRTGNQKYLPAEKRTITDDDIVAQAILFFLAGIDPVSSSMCFLCYELAVNTDIQDRLRQEVDSVVAECGSSTNISYNHLLEMKYLDMVVSETLRKWPFAPLIDRMCTKAYEITPVNPTEKPIKLEMGFIVWLPVFAIHRDSNFYAEPECFDPERFNDENRNKIKPGVYMPFGLGPRNCIASRFAMLEIKAVIFQLLAHFEILPVQQTVIPLKLNRSSPNLKIDGGLWLGLKKRSIS